MKIRSRKHLSTAAALAAIVAQSCSLSAADLLRPAAAGGGANSTVSGGSSGGSTGGALREQSLINNREALARANRTLRDIQRMQAAARAAATTRPTTVPDGLTPGGLQVAPGATVGSALWNGARLPVQSATLGGRTEVTVKQTASQAFLTWQSFNIGRNTDLVFDQSAGGADRAQWIAFNQINDPSESPSRILGSIRADGQVYVINRNGVIFDGTSQVNVRGLTVSTLPINTNLVGAGLLNNPDAQFLFSGLAIPAGANGTAAFTPEPPPVSTGVFGDIVIESGAELNSPLTADGGGRITLVASNVRNEGVIRTPGGQTILAAGLQVGFTAHDSADATLRGLDAHVGLLAPAGTAAADIRTGEVVNSGLIDVPRGSAQLVGRNITVNGAIDSTTSVSLNGRIDLRAAYGAVARPVSATSSTSAFLSTETGRVDIGDGALLRVMPEVDSKEKIAAETLALRSTINVTGRTIHLGEDSTVLAPGGVVNMDAGVLRLTTDANPTSVLVNSGGQIYLDRGALVSVAGTAGVEVDVARNIIAVELRGAELADSPLQRNGFLRGQTIYVDIRETGTFNGVDWVGTPLADVSGYVGLIERTVAELTTDAGQVNLRAGGSIVMCENSLVDVSAGWIDYQGGNVRTTRLYADGRLVDIADAIPTVSYDALYTGTTTVVSPRWGVSTTYRHPIQSFATRYEEGYVQGAAGGSVTLVAESMALDGAFAGRDASGPRQRDTRPDLSGLTLDFTSREHNGTRTPSSVATRAPDVVFVDAPSAVTPDDFSVDADGNPADLPAERVATVQISTGLFADSGLGALIVNNPEGDVTLDAGRVIDAPVGGTIDLRGANVTIEGSIIAPGGTVALTANNVSLDVANDLEFGVSRVNPAPVAGRGVVSVGSGATLSTAGLVVNDLVSPGAVPTAARHAGAINITGFSTLLAEGSTLDVSGGYLLDADGSLDAGDAGSIRINAGRDSRITSVIGGELRLDATLAGYADASAQAGSLSILAPTVRIGGGAGADAALVLDPEFFNEGGFGAFTITGIGARTATADVFTPGVAITAGTRIAPEVESLFATADAGGAVSIGRRLEQRGVRPAAELTFLATGARDPYAGELIVRGEVSLADGASIETEAGGSINLSGQAVDVRGSIIAPGGSITVAGASTYERLVPDDTRALPTVVIGRNARLDASGEVVLLPDPLGLRTGSVLGGGDIKVSGNVLAHEGAVIATSGTSGVLDLTPNYGGHFPEDSALTASRVVPVEIFSAGGSITLEGGELLASDATLVARSGGGGAAGGSLTLSSGLFYQDGDTVRTSDRDLTVVQSGNTFAAAGSGLGAAVTTAGGDPVKGGGRFAADRLNGAGFDDVTLGGNVSFEGPVTITVPGRLRVGAGGVVEADGRVELNAGHVALGRDFVAPQDPTQQPFLFTETVPGIGQRELNFLPEHGDGRLLVNADHIDLGTLSTQGVGLARFTAEGGDIRGNGFVNVAGDLELRAGQIYPTTGSTFTLTAFDHAVAGGGLAEGVVRVISAGARPDLPASAGGTLNVFASRIEQNSTLRAPFGVINLGVETGGSGPRNAVTGTNAAPTHSLVLGADSLTSVSAVRADGSLATLPYGLVVNGTTWIDPRGVDITLGGLPEKSVNLSADDIETAAGSVVDVRGGGDLLAYRFVPGTGGSRDLLAESGAFAVIPGAQWTTSPYAPFNPTPVDDSLGGDLGYVSSGLSVGDQIVLDGSNGLPAGTYTLLPARYALLPGAFLVTPVSAPPVGTTVLPDGSSLVSGHRVDGFTGRGVQDGVVAGFEVASQKVVLQRAEYEVELANDFLRDAAETRGGGTPRLPVDSGRLVFNAGGALVIGGSVEAAPPKGGRGSEVDISSPLDIIIAGADAAPTPGALTLDAAGLGRFGAASLLVGGLRTSTAEGALITTTANNLTVDNAGTPLVGSDIILVARENLTVAADADIRSAGSAAGGTSLAVTLGSADTAGSGDGALLRVASSTSATASRAGVSTSAVPSLVVEGGAHLTGGSVLLDSSARTTVAGDAGIDADALGLNSGRISLVLDESADASAAGGLILSDAALKNALGSARALSLLSYSTIDLFGEGTVGSADFASLSLTAPALRRFGSGDITFAAADIRLDNTTRRAAPAVSGDPSSGRLTFDAKSVTIADGSLAIQGFDRVELNASERVRLAGEGGLVTTGDLHLNTPLVSAATGAEQVLEAGGDFRLAASGVAAGVTDLGLGSQLTVRGDSVTLDGVVRLPSGRLVAEARDGDVIAGGDALLDVGGVARKFFDRTEVTSGGSILLSSEQGSVRLLDGSTLDVSSPTTAGRAGTLEVRAPEGVFVADGVLHGDGADRGGSFALDTESLPTTASIDALLDASGFAESRSYRVRTGDVTVDGAAHVAEYRLSADGGDITVTGEIDASGQTGGEVGLRASGNLTLADGALIDVSGRKFSSAGKGGSVDLEAGAQIDGVVSPTARLALQAGSVIDLSVAASAADDAMFGRVTGTLSLRAPVTADGTDVRVDAIGSTIIDPSYVSLEGFRLYDLTGSGGSITTAVQNTIRTDAQTLLGAAGSTTAGYTAMRDRLLSLQPDFGSSLVIRPGAEIINRTGDLTLGTTASTATSDWNLATFRFGPDSAPGVLTLRAAGDLVFHNALSDGFSGGASLWLSPLTNYNAALPLNLQTWDYRLTAGSDLLAADHREVLAMEDLGAGKGSLLLGKNTGAATVGSGGANAATATLIANNFQVIRTGSGDIDISTGRDILLQNPFAAIYTAGTKVPDATSVFTAGDFVLPVTVSTLSQGSLGSAPQNSVAQYALAGGDVRLEAQGNIRRITKNTAGEIIDDSSRQLPNNWLYRRSSVNDDGVFGEVRLSINAFSSFVDAAASTTWWVDYTNFFQSVGALGGGDVTLLAGANISNVDAVIPTNARMPRGEPDAGKLVELGGGDLLVRAGNDIDGGVYYVQRGHGVLDAGGDITTNATRSLNLGILGNLANPVRLPESTWMPTTLFLGDATFDVGARGDVLLGPIGNPHLLPQGNGNRYWYKTYFSTYGETAGVDVASLVGDVTLRNVVTLPSTRSSVPFLQAWLNTQNLFAGVGNTSAAYYQPWLRLAESRVDSFGTLATLLPPNLLATTFSGDINLGGDFNLFPSPTGQLGLLAAGSLNALTTVGESTQLVAGSTVSVWETSRINLSDASPASLPGITNPFSYYVSTGSSTAAAQNNTTRIGFLGSINSVFAETGATDTVLQTRQTLHAPGRLHLDDDTPAYLYAAGGDFSGLTLFSAKPVVASAARDLTDIAFYIQNNRADQTSVVSAGRDLVFYAPNSEARVLARSAGNALGGGQQTLAGDIQISGPGTLEVLAGRDIDLGIGYSNTNGTAAGITSVGNVRNPALPQDGADIVVAAGLGGGLALADTAAAHDAFVAKFLDPDTGGAFAGRYLPELGRLIGLTGADDEVVFAAFNDFPQAVRARLVLDLFNLVLRDAGRDRNDPDSDTFGTYRNGFAAIETLFPGKSWNGDISLTSRQIKTAAGGDVSIFAPGGALTIGLPGAGQRPDQGVLTEAGGDIDIFTRDSVNVGTSRIFTLRGGDIFVWSSKGDIAAGSAAKTVRSAPPTRVLIDPQSASVKTDLSGLATGGGIGVLQTVAGVEPGNVDLIAPEGVIDAGDAGIRSSGNLNLAAASVLNAANIQTGGSTVGAPAATPSLNLGAIASASTTTVAAAGSGIETARPDAAAAAAAAGSLPSIFNVEVIGYGGGDGSRDEEEDKKSAAAGSEKLSLHTDTSTIVTQS